MKTVNQKYPGKKQQKSGKKIKFERKKEPTNNCMTKNFFMNELNSAIKKLKTKNLLEQMELLMK